MPLLDTNRYPLEYAETPNVDAPEEMHMLPPE